MFQITLKQKCFYRQRNCYDLEAGRNGWLRLAAYFPTENNTAVNDADAKPMTSVNASTWRIVNAAAAAAVLASGADDDAA